MDIVEIKSPVSDAFTGVTLGDGYSLRDMEEMDNWGERGSEEDWRLFPDVETRDDWAALSLETLDRYAGLAHIDALGFRYYVPAFMLSVLDDYQPSDMRFICTLSALYPRRGGLAEYKISRYALLNPKQRSAIACYLQALPSLVPLDGGDEKCVERAIRNYWHKFLPQV